MAGGKTRVIHVVSSHPFTKMAVSKMDIVSLGAKLADDDPPGQQMVDTMENDSAAKIWKCLAIATAACWMPINIASLFFLQMYAFMNPDPEEVWASNDSTAVFNEKPAEGDYTDYGSLFRLWFLIGFIIVSLWTLTSIFFIVGVCCKQSWAMCISCFGQVAAIANIVWVILGAIWLSSAGGQAAIGASKDDLTFQSTSSYMESSGMFMSIFLLIEFIFIGLQYIVCPLVCVIVGCCGSKDD